MTTCRLGAAAAQTGSWPDLPGCSQPRSCTLTSPRGSGGPAGRGRALGQLLPEPARRKGGPGAPLLLPWGKAEVRPGHQEAPSPPPRSCTPSHRDAARGCGGNSVLPWVREANHTRPAQTGGKRRAWSVLCLARAPPRIQLDQVQARPSRTGPDTLLCRVPPATRSWGPQARHTVGEHNPQLHRTASSGGPVVRAQPPSRVRGTELQRQTAQTQRTEGRRDTRARRPGDTESSREQDRT